MINGLKLTRCRVTSMSPLHEAGGRAALMPVLTRGSFRAGSLTCLGLATREAGSLTSGGAAQRSLNGAELMSAGAGARSTGRELVRGDAGR